MSNLELKKWEQLLAELDIDLQCFWGLELIYPGKVSTLDDQNLEAFAQSNEINDIAFQFFRMNQAELEKFELKVGYKLPLEYRNYLQIFGEGRFGTEGFCIESPNIYDFNAFLEKNISILESCFGSFEINKRLTIEIQHLIKNAYIFGRTDDVILVFDLRTWSSNDQSYDIYGLNFSSCCYFKIGRNFFEFVRDCCIGEKIKRNFPDLIFIDENEDDLEFNDKNNVFIPFPDVRLLDCEDQEQWYGLVEEWKKEIH
jgi:hypothetical protein